MTGGSRSKKRTFEKNLEPCTIKKENISRGGQSTTWGRGGQGHWKYSCRRSSRARDRTLWLGRWGRTEAWIQEKDVGGRSEKKKKRIRRKGEE